jgi:hypothetical protein
MASYNKEKLLKLLERRRMGALALRDCSNRRYEAQDDANRLRTSMLVAGRNLRANAGAELERILGLPLDKVQSIRVDEVSALVDPVQWRQWLFARARKERLDAECETLEQQNAEAFAIIPELLLKVREWGFNDPEYEVM